MLRRHHRLVTTGIAATLLSCCLAIFPPHGEADAQLQLITGIDTQPFFSEIGWSPPADVTIGPVGVEYTSKIARASGAKSVSIGVYQSTDAAVAACDRHIAQVRATPAGEAAAGIGDQLTCTAPYGDPPRQTIILRRTNAIVTVSWEGDREQGLEFARKIDQTLRASDGTCPKGTEVPQVEVELIAPKIVALGALVQVRYRAGGGMSVRTEADAALRPGGEISYRAGELGEHTLRFQFATSKNVLFARSVALTVVAPEDLPATVNAQAWEWPGDALHFINAADQDWSAAPEDQRETLTPHEQHLASLKDEDDWRQRALNDLSEIVQPRWVPAPELIHARGYHARPGNDTAYYATFTSQGCKVLYMGLVGRQVLIYIEQPDPLPGGQKLLTAEDLVRDDVLSVVKSDTGEQAYPRAGFMVRTFHRYRAFKPDGPYEPVNILLARFRFAEETNLRFPGYQ